MFRLEDFIADYPEQSDEQIQTKLTAKRELNELAPGVTETLNGRGEFYKHQILYYRIFKNYKRSLILDRTGTGKSCEIISIAEYFKNIESIGKNPLDEFPHIKKIIFLVKGPNIQDELRNQLVFRCTPEGTYDTQDILTTESNKRKENLITRAIKDWYEIEPFETFANKLHLKSDEQVRKEYSGTMIFIDEGQYLKSESDNIEAELIAEMKEFEELERLKKKNAKKPNIYNQIWRLTHLVERSHVYIATATPMINDPKELSSKLNLLNPIDKQIKFRQFDWNTVTSAQLEPYIRGLISYVRELDTGITLVEEGKPANVYFGDLRSQVIIYNTTMSQVQSNAYERARNSNHRQGINGTEELGDSFYWNELSASNFVFPDGTWGGDFEVRIKKQDEEVEEIRQEFKEEEKKIRGKKPKKETRIPNLGKVEVETNIKGISEYVRHGTGENFESTPEFRSYLSDINNIKQSSSKYYDIIRRYSRAHNGDKNIGKGFVYGKMKSGSGLYVLSLCLEAHGFDRFDNNFTSFEPNAELRRRVIKKDFVKKPRFALITGSTSGAIRKSIMELYNSYENRHGEYIQILLGSEVTQAGINLSDVVNFEFVSTEWHMSGSYQALSRILRATSHENLLRELRATNPNAILEIKIYRHSASTVMQTINFNNTKYEFNKITGPGDLSTDIYAYLTSEDKDIRIKRIEHFLINNSVNFIINFTRNHRNYDKDYSPICYYEKCDKMPENKYNVVPLNDTNRWDNLSISDTSTYDIYYVYEIVDYIISQFKEIFKIKSTYTLDELTKLTQFQKIPIKYFVIAANSINNRNIIFLDRQGSPTYMGFRCNVFYLINKYFNTPTYTDLYYSMNKIITTNSSFKDYVKTLVVKIDVYDRLNRLFESAGREIKDSEIESLGIDEKAELLEKSISHIEVGEATDFDNYIYDFYKYLIFVFNKPVQALAVVNSLERMSTASGKKLKKEFEEKFFGLDFNATDGTRVIIHTMYNLQTTKGNYNDSITYKSIIGRIRIYDPNLGGWIVNTTESEDLVYKYMCNYAIYLNLELYEEKGTYGIITYNDKFLVKDTKDETETRNKGRNCIHFEKIDLIDILYRSDYVDTEIKDVVNIEQKLATLHQKASGFEFNVEDMNKINFYYYMLQDSTANLCEILQNHLEAIGSIFYTKDADYTEPPDVIENIDLK